MEQNRARHSYYLFIFQTVTAFWNRILKSQNVENFLHFADIFDMREKILHIPDIKVFCGKLYATLSRN